MKKVTLITLILLLSIFISTSFAVEVTLLEKEYVRTKGKPDLYSDIFIGMEGEGKLIITNGDEGGKHRISSAVIIVNGEQVVGSNQFDQKVNVVEVPINVIEDNTISIELRSKPGSNLTIKIIQEVEAEAAAVIGPEGGVVEVTDPESPVYGTKMVIPSGAVDEDTVISLSEGVTVDDPDLIGTAVLCSPDGHFFEKEVEITIPLEEPFPADDTLSLMVFNEELGEYEFGGRLTLMWFKKNGHHAKSNYSESEVFNERETKTSKLH